MIIGFNVEDDNGNDQFDYFNTLAEFIDNGGTVFIQIVDFQNEIFTYEATAVAMSPTVIKFSNSNSALPLNLTSSTTASLSSGKGTTCIISGSGGGPAGGYYRNCLVNHQANLLGTAATLPTFGAAQLYVGADTNRYPPGWAINAWDQYAGAGTLGKAGSYSPTWPGLEVPNYSVKLSGTPSPALTAHNVECQFSISTTGAGNTLGGAVHILVYRCSDISAISGKGTAPASTPVQHEYTNFSIGNTSTANGTCGEIKFIASTANPSVGIGDYFQVVLELNTGVGWAQGDAVAFNYNITTLEATFT